MNEALETIREFSDVGISVFGILIALVSIIAALRAGVLSSLRHGSVETQASGPGAQETREVILSVTHPDAERVPFETEQLANYYAQVLAQSRTSFWFSLVFASLGFLIIIFAAFMHADAKLGSTIARFVAGGVVDAVAALFFVQSNQAQKSMAEFFDKLRRDRNHVEARRLCENVATTEAKDALRVRLALHYAEADDPDTIAESIMTKCLGPAVSREPTDLPRGNDE